MKKIFHLNLTKKWFDLIAAGEKKEEYRAITPYWQNRFKYDYIGLTQVFMIILKGKQHTAEEILICFSNGYHPDRRQMTIELKNIKVGTGQEKWGAVKNEQYFILELGDIINKNF